MAYFDSVSVLAKIGQTRIVPVFYDADPEVACSVVRACYEGGIRVFEFTNRGHLAHEVFRAVRLFAAQACPDMALGVGSVVDAPTAALYLQMGADFVVGPLLNADVARVCHRRCVPYVPGCGSISEVGLAQELGCLLVKAFPGDVLGPAFVKSLLAPMPWTKLMVTGGVEPTAESLRTWFRAGTFCVGMGSKLFPKDAVREGRWTDISQLCRDALQVAREG